MVKLLTFRLIEPLQGSEVFDYQPTVNSIYGYSYLTTFVVISLKGLNVNSRGC